MIGIVLIGGKSTRMGRDKFLISYNRMPQYQYCEHLLRRHCEEVYFSIRPEQLPMIRDHLARRKRPIGAAALERRFILDKESSIGPCAGIISAHRAHPLEDLFVLACDLPLLRRNHMKALAISHSNPNEVTLYSPKEPLCGVWGVNVLKDLARSRAVEFNHSLVRYLQHQNLNIVAAPEKSANFLANINSPKCLPHPSAHASVR